MLNVEHDLLLLTVVSDEGVDSVAVRDPPNQTRVGRQGGHRIPLNTVDGKERSLIKLGKNDAKCCQLQLVSHNRVNT